MSGGRDEPRPLGDALERVVAGLGGPSVSGLTTLFGRWEEIVGPQLAAHVRPQGIDDGVLAVLVDEPGWATQVRFLQADLLRRLAEVLGPDVVRSVVVRTGGGPGRRSRGRKEDGW